ncbi:MAG TPA: FMN-binding protein [Gemmatimonadaceae bacterium]|jgi:electron transport complex protein RnfG
MTHDATGHGSTATRESAPAGAPAWRLLATLGGAGALAGLLIVLTWQWTTPPIEAHRALVLQQAIAEVLRHPARWDTLYLEGDQLVRQPSVGADVARLEKAWLGFDANGIRLGVAVTAGEPGFADVVSLIFAWDPDSRRLLAMKVIGSKETPGLGDRIEKDSAFVSQFRGPSLPLKGVKAASGADPAEVDVITGATISSRTVIRAINAAVARWQPRIEAFDREGRP